MKIFKIEIPDFCDQRDPKKNPGWISSAAYLRLEHDVNLLDSIPPLPFEKPSKCPHCGCEDQSEFVKDGHNRSNRQLYKCKRCNHKFPVTIGTPYYRHRLNQYDMSNVGIFLSNGETVRATARRCGISIQTAITYRHNILEGLQNHYNIDDLGKKLTGDYVMVDETFNPIQGAVKQNGGVKKRGISDQKDSIAVGIDSNKYVKLYITGVAPANREQLDKIWDDKIDKDVILIHDKKNSYDFKGFKEEKAINSKIKKEEAKLNPLNSLCSGLQWHLFRHHGMSSKNLQLYLTWYAYLVNNNPKKALIPSDYALDKVIQRNKSSSIINVGIPY